MSDSTRDTIKEENEALASLLGTRGYKVLERWMKSQYNSAVQGMMDERKREDNIKVLAREAKIYQKVMGRVSSAAQQLKREPF
jgi:hypothetical protein